MNNEAPREFALLYAFLFGGQRFPRQTCWSVPTGGYLGVAQGVAAQEKFCLLHRSRVHGAFQKCLYRLVLFLLFTYLVSYFAKANNGSWVKNSLPSNHNGEILHPVISLHLLEAAMDPEDREGKRKECLSE